MYNKRCVRIMYIRIIYTIYIYRNVMCVDYNLQYSGHIISNKYDSITYIEVTMCLCVGNVSTFRDKFLYAVTEL